jgi:3-oxoacyl-[acyl-carrier-protein] synthase-1
VAVARSALAIMVEHTATGHPITAVALCNALGVDVANVTAAIARGTSGLAPLGDAPGLHGSCGELEPLPASLRDHDTRQARIAAQTVVQIKDAIDRANRRWGASRVAIVIGTSTGGIAATEAAWTPGAPLPPTFDLYRHHAMSATIDVVRAICGARGSGHAISTACSSSAKAFASAQRLIEANLADAVIVGGVDSLCEMTVRGFAALELVAPAGCRPLSAERNGLSLGEGGALALVERRGDAATRIVAVGESCDAYHMSAPHPEGDGAARAMLDALQRAGVAADRIGFINAHATGTLLNDAAEAKAIVRVLGSHVPVVATKGYTGHLLGAAGATEVILTALALAEGRVPASLGCGPIDPTLGIDVVEHARTLECELAMSTSFAFGGSNAAVIVGVT